MHLAPNPVTGAHKHFVSRTPEAGSHFDDYIFSFATNKHISIRTDIVFIEFTSLAAS